MKTATIGDLAQSLQLRRDTSRVKNDLNGLTREMSSGRMASLNAALMGQFGPLAGINRSLALIDANIASNATAARLASAQQVALGTVQDLLQAAGPEFLETSSAGSDIQRKVVVQKASGQFEGMVSALNTRIEDKALFAGAALGGPALTDAEGILAELELALIGATQPSDVISRVADWFASPGGGFENSAYLGAVDPMSDIAIASGETVRLDMTAADPAVRNSLRGLALGALIDRGLFAGDTAAQRTIMEHAGEALFTATRDITVSRASLGFAEARIEAARVRTEAETTGLTLARAALVEADPYDTALRLQQVQVQLETIYAVTARVSNLSLARVLR